jgi:hypothetical protein
MQQTKIRGSQIFTSEIDVKEMVQESTMSFQQQARLKRVELKYMINRNVPE